MHVDSASDLPVSPPSSLPCGAEKRANLGFPEKAESFYPLLSPGAPALSSLGLTLARCSYTKQGGPQNFLLHVEISSGAGVRLLDSPYSHLCLKAWHCPLSGDSAFFSEDGQAT